MKIPITSFGAHGLLFLACLFWGIAYIFVKLVLRELPAPSFALLRFVAASVVLGAFLAFTARPTPRIARKHIPGLLLAALTGIVGYQLPVAWALEYTPASTAGVLNAAGPAFTLVLGRLMLSERLTKEKVAGITISIVGVLTVILRGSGEAQLDFSHILGPIFVTIGVLAYALCTVLLKPLLDSYPHVYVSSIHVILGTAMLLPVVFTMDYTTVANLSWLAWGSIIYLGAVSTAVGQIFYNFGLSRLDASQAAAYLYLIPFISVASAAPILGETITIYLLLGGVLIIGGIVIANRSPRKVVGRVDSKTAEPAALAE